MGKIEESTEAFLKNWERKQAKKRHNTTPKHRLSRSRVYEIWAGMLKRCDEPKHASYKYYGGRGISVCDRWRTFENFLADMGHPPDGTSLDRIDNDGNYEPTNCRWATAAVQAKNKRPRSPVDPRTLLKKRQAAYRKWKLNRQK